MAFVGEYVGQAKYDALCSNPIFRFGRIYIPTQWAVDVDAKAFLGDYGFDRERLSWSYVFWWRGSYFTFEVEIGAAPSSGDTKSPNKLCKFLAPIQLPPEMVGQGAEVRTKVEEALIAYESFPLGPVDIIFENWEVV